MFRLVAQRRSHQLGKLAGTATARLTTVGLYSNYSIV